MKYFYWQLTSKDSKSSQAQVVKRSWNKEKLEDKANYLKQLGFIVEIKKCYCSSDYLL